VDFEGVDFELGAVAEDVVRRLALRADAGGSRIQCLIGSDVPRALHGDADRLHQVLTSLIGTAMEATGSGPVQVRISVQADGRFRFEAGGSPAAGSQWDRVLGALPGPGSGDGPPTGGTELRLAVCQRLAEGMGGELGGEGSGDGGGRLWFSARLAPARGAAAPAANGHRPAEAGEARPRVLVADDSPVNQEVARRTLERMGYEVGIAANGAAAVEAAATGSYAAVLMDCQMPGMDGYEATKAIREREGDGRHTPVIAMTASDLEADRRRCLAAGMDDYVAKPFEYEDLEAVLARWAGAPSR
jgi:CheY-like chemotaxis protein